MKTIKQLLDFFPKTECSLLFLLAIAERNFGYFDTYSKSRVFKEFSKFAETLYEDSSLVYFDEGKEWKADFEYCVSNLYNFDAHKRNNRPPGMDNFDEIIDKFPII